MADEALQSRLEALERQAAHTERMLEELNAVVIAQGRALARLERLLEATEDRLAGIEHAARGNVPEPPPPHF